MRGQSIVLHNVCLFLSDQLTYVTCFQGSESQGQKSPRNNQGTFTVFPSSPGEGRDNDRLMGTGGRGALPSKLLSGQGVGHSGLSLFLDGNSPSNPSLAPGECCPPSLAQVPNANPGLGPDKLLFK